MPDVVYGSGGGPVLARKRPVIVELFVYDGTNGPQIVDWSKGHATYSHFDGLVVFTPQGELKCDVDGAVVHGPNDEYYPVKPATRRSSFELLTGAKL